MRRKPSLGEPGSNDFCRLGDDNRAGQGHTKEPDRDGGERSPRPPRATRTRRPRSQVTRQMACPDPSCTHHLHEGTRADQQRSRTLLAIPSGMLNETRLDETYLTTMTLEIGEGFQELAAPRDLDHVLAAVWVRVMPDEPVPTVEVWPDAGADVIWYRGNEALVAGPDLEPVPATLEPGAVMIGARFMPGAAGPVLRTRMAELVNQRLPLSGVRPELAKALDNGSSPVAALRQLLEGIRKWAFTDPPDTVVSMAARLLDDPLRSIDSVGEESSIGARQLRRRFNDAVGYGPKSLQRVLRFQRLVAALRARPGDDLATLAIETGYSDQAHMTRDVRRLSRRTPGQLRLAVSE